MRAFSISYEKKPENDAKFTRLYHNYRQMMYYTAHKILFDKDLSEDAVQNAFLKLLPNLDKIDEADTVKTKHYLMKSARNAAITILNDSSVEIPVSDDEFKTLLPDDLDTPERQVLSQEQAEHLRLLMADMKPEHQQILTAVYLRNYKIGKAAQLLNLPGTAARKRLQRAKLELKALLLQEGLEL